MIEKLDTSGVVEGKLYRIIGNAVIEVVLHGEELLPITDPITKEIPGQLALDLT